ncbi:MAG TPA: O-antigen ligase family protein [Patescibacteria group bacterium]|nr:O-antigen ligase family protein [Patescibacteria group bacterium]
MTIIPVAAARPSLLLTAIIHVLLAATIAAIPLLMIAMDGWREVYAVGILGLCTVGTVLLHDRLAPSAIAGGVGLYALLAVPVLLSILANPSEESHLVNILVLGSYVLLGPVILHTPTDATYRSFFPKLGVTVTVASLVALFLAADSSFANLLVDQREGFDFLDINLHPNYIGLLSVVIALSVSGVRSEARRLAGTVVALVLTWPVSSRAGALGVVVAYACPFLFRRSASISAEDQRRNKVVLIAVGIGIVLVALLFHSALISFISDNVLLLDDDDRGLESGFSERTEIWQAAYELWWSQPLFGVGYGQGVEKMGFGMYAHNIVLVLLSETGVVGFLGFVGFTLLSLRNGYRLRQRGELTQATYLLTGIVVYWAYGIFEGLAINAGNPLSAAFFTLAFGCAGQAKAGPLTAEAQA